MDDNRSVIVPRARSQEDQFASAVAKVEPMLAPQVVRLRYSLEDDWTGELAVFFRVILSDAAVKSERLGNLADRVSTVVDREIEPMEQWGVFPYFNYRSQSDQAQLNDPAWA